MMAVKGPTIEDAVSVVSIVIRAKLNVAGVIILRLYHRCQSRPIEVDDVVDVDLPRYRRLVNGPTPSPLSPSSGGGVLGLRMMTMLRRR
jgi:hypothetical protein